MSCCVCSIVLGLSEQKKEGKATTLPHALLTPKQAEDLQAEFKRLAQDAGVKGARIDVHRVIADDSEKVIHEAKACLRNAMPKAA